MENATKALLIAAAVLVAILVISLGLVIYNQSAESIQKLNMSDNEIKAFNDQWTRYEGNRSGNDVNALLQTAVQNNLKYQGDDVNKRVDVIIDSNTVINKNQENTYTTTPSKVPTGNRYDVTVQYDPNTQLISSITCNVHGGTPSP